MVRPARIIDFTLADIEQSARAHFAANEHRPTKRSGAITTGPLKDKDLNWNHIFVYFRTEKPDGHTSFADFMTAKKIVNPDTKPTLDEIEQSAREKFTATGKRPSKLDQEIEHGPLKDKGQKWGNIDAAFKLEIYPGFKSLAGFLDSRKVLNPDAKPALDDIAQSARDRFTATGKRPSKLDQEIEHGPLKGKGQKWANIDTAFKLDSYPGFKSLAGFLDSRKVGIRRYNLKMIERSMRSTMDETGVTSITRNSGPILHGPLKAYKTTWENIHCAMKSGYSGLKKCGFYSLTDFRTARDIKPTLHELFTDMADIARKLQSPAALTDTFQKAATHKVQKWDVLLEKNSIKGWEFFMPDMADLAQRPKSSMDFCLATGLIQHNGDRLVYANDQDINTISRAVLAKRAPSAQ